MQAKLLLLALCTFVFAVSTLFPAVVNSNPDPCLIVYTTDPTVYHYDISEYYTVSTGHPLYDPMYDRGGEVLIDINTNEIALDIYQAPNLTGFEMSTGGEEGYFSIGTEFDLVIDGWSNNPTTYVNILLVFDPDPDYCSPVITVDGDPVSGDTYPCGDLVVTTPTPDGNNYSDTMTKHIVWSGCSGVRIWAFSDANYNGQMDGGECFSAYSHDLTIPVELRSWGAIKSLYKE
jgi:hypothetical protein